MGTAMTPSSSSSSETADGVPTLGSSLSRSYYTVNPHDFNSYLRTVGTNPMYNPNYSAQFQSTQRSVKTACHRVLARLLKKGVVLDCRPHTQNMLTRVFLGDKCLKATRGEIALYDEEHQLFMQSTREEEMAKMAKAKNTVRAEMSYALDEVTGNTAFEEMKPVLREFLMRLIDVLWPLDTCSLNN